MSESNQNIPSTSQESVAGAQSSEVKPDFASSMTESEKSENVPATKIAKPTGLKLHSSGITPAPTRIGRLCNNIPKPAVPPNPSVSNGTGVGGGGTMSTASSIRKISDELARKRLADVEETDENTVPYYGGGKWPCDRKMSSGSALSDCSRQSDELRKRSSDASVSADSFGDYWKSDFEPRRASDASVVLTEDTDQFIIGDRVWVGGVKAGQIAYIGETQFAPGEWAGVVLDEPIGKNDGTVANIRYFQCPPKKGIFSRLTRLTRYPLVEGGAGEPAAPRSAPPESRKSNGSVLAAVPKRSSLVLAPSATSKNSASKPPSPDSALHPNVQVGDRVIVKSSQGSKAGILRYLGTTDFAAGDWCGVELDDPLGKNDGSVSGTRYFECRPKFGLFAPLHKVSKSPASKRPSQANCVVHRGGANPGIPRQGSKESLVSISSSASTAASMRSTNRKIGVRTPTTPTSAKNALQETLKEKELHIEQLLKERDLERAEVTRAASQADEAERRLASLKQEFEQQKEEAEARASDLDAMVCLLKSENEELKNLLDDERKKLEDLQFRLEEETIDKADIKAMSLKYEEKMRMLEKTLFEERKRTEALEQDSNKLFEAEEQMVILRDELDSAREEMSDLKKIRMTLEQEHISLEAHLTSARAEMESLKMENECLKSSASQDQSHLKENLARTALISEELKKELEQKQAEANRQAVEIETRVRAYEEKEKEIHSKYLKIINDLTEKHKSESENTARNLEDARNAAETKLKLLEVQLEEKMKACDSLETKLNEVKILLSKAEAEKSVERNKQKEAEHRLREQLREAAEELQRTRDRSNEETAKREKLLSEKEKLEEELREARKSLTSVSESTDKRVVALNSFIDEQKKQLQETKAELESKSNECESLRAFACTSQQENDGKIKELEETLRSRSSELEKTKERLENIKAKLETKNDEAKRLYEANEEILKSKVQDLERSEAEAKKEIEELTGELKEAKHSLEARESELRSERATGRDSTLKLNALEESYKNVLEENGRLRLEAGDAGRRLQTIEEKLLQVTAQKVKLEEDMSNFINTSNDSSLQLAKLHEDLRVKEREVDALREDISRKSGNFERTEQELKQIVERQQAELKSTEEEWEKTRKNSILEIEALKNKLEMVSSSWKQAEEEWKKKAENVSRDSETRVKDLEERLRHLERKAAEDRNKHEDYVKCLMDAQTVLEAKVAEEEARSEECGRRLAQEIENLKAERNKLLDTVEKTKSESTTRENELREKVEREAEMQASESEKLRNELRETNEKLATATKELDREKEEKNKLNEEKSKVEKAAAATEELLAEIRAKNTELEVKTSSVEGENKILKESIDRLREEKGHLDKDSTEKMMMVAELRSQLEALEYSKKIRDAENEVKIKNLENETTDLKSRLQKTESEKKRQVEDLRREVERLKEESSQVASAKEKDAENANLVVGLLQKELEESKRECERKREETSKAEKSLQQTRLELEAEQKKREEYGMRLNASESEREDLKEKFKEQTRALANTSDLRQKLEEASEKLRQAKKREEELASNSKLERETLEKMLETTSGLLSQRENEAKALAKEADALREEKAVIATQTKSSLEALEAEKIDLLKKLEEVKQTAGKVQTSTISKAEVPETSRSDLEEEREFAKGQVDFLNSVIVDMQKKNDALKARIEILEMGFSPEDVDEFNLHNISTRSVAPRLFCDICDRFDLHDTEDCPTQAMEDVPPPKSSKSKAPPPERPYCEICEVFGHDTADCDDAETF